MRKSTFIFSFLSIFFFVQYTIAADRGDSLRKIIRQTQSDTVRISTLNYLGWHTSFTDLDSGLIFSLQALSMLEKLAPGKGVLPKWKDETLAKAHFYLGEIYTEKADYKTALVHFQKSLILYKKLKNDVRISTVYGSIGLQYMHQGNYPQALNYYFKGLRIDEQTNNKKLIAVKLGNIGIVYDNLGEYDKALGYYNRVIHIAREMKDSSRIATQFGNIAILYSNQNEFVKAREYFMKELKIQQSLNDYSAIVRINSNIGSNYIEEGNEEKGLEYLFKSLEMAQKLGNQLFVAVNYVNIADVYSSQKKYSQAESFFMKGLALAESSKDIDLVMQIEELISDMYMRSGDHKKSLEHYKKFIIARDKIFNEENTRKNLEEEMNFNFEKKEALQKAENKKKVAELEAENTIQHYLRNFIIGISIMLLLLVVGGMIYFQNRKNLQMQQQYSQQLLISQEKEKERIARELHDSIGQNILFMRNQMVRSQQTELLSSVDETIQEVRNISWNLYPTQLEKYGLISAVDALAEKVQEQSDIFVSHDLEALDVELDNNQKINYYRIIQECISNTLKYADASALRISTETKPDGIELIIQDNGKGFDKSILARKSRRSMGMLNIEERVKYLKGKFELETSPGNGTRYTFLIPS